MFISDSPHRVLKSHRNKMSIVYMLSWKEYAVLVITRTTLWQLMHLGTWCTVIVLYVPKCMSCCKAIVMITGRAHCFHYIYIYIYDLPEETISIWKIFVDDTTLSLKVINTIYSENTLNADIKSISNWAYQWKMQFNPDPKKQTNEVIFSRKSNTVWHPPVIFNNSSIAKCLYGKH